MQLANCKVWFDTVLPGGSVVHDEHGEQWIVVEQRSRAGYLWQHVIRTRDGALLHPSYMQFPVGVSDPGQNLT